MSVPLELFELERLGLAALWAFKTPMALVACVEGRVHRIALRARGRDQEPARVRKSGAPLRDRIARLIPTAAKQNHASLFALCRLARDVESDHGLKPKTLPNHMKREMFDVWYDMVPQEYFTKSRSEYWVEFPESFLTADIGLRTGSLKGAWHQSGNREPPAEAFDVFPDDDATEARRIVTLADVLASDKADGIVFLPASSIAKPVSEEVVEQLRHPPQVNRIVRAMEDGGLIELVTKHHRVNRRATEWRYLPRLTMTPTRSG